MLLLPVCENNGFVGNNMYDPEMDAYFAIRDRDAVENPAWYETHLEYR